MARIAGVNIPTGKRVPIALTYITGIGRSTAEEICSAVKIDAARRVNELSDARKLYVKKTGGKLRDVRTAGAYKKLSAADKKRYRKLNPDDFPVDEDFSLKKKTLLGA